VAGLPGPNAAGPYLPERRVEGCERTGWCSGTRAVAALAAISSVRIGSLVRIETACAENDPDEENAPQQ